MNTMVTKRIHGVHEYTTKNNTEVGCLRTVTYFKKLYGKQFQFLTYKSMNI